MKTSWVRFRISKVKDNPKIILKSSLFQPNNHAEPSPVVLSPCISHATQICRNMWVPGASFFCQTGYWGYIQRSAVMVELNVCMPAPWECLPAGAKVLDHTGLCCQCRDEHKAQHCQAFVCQRGDKGAHGGVSHGGHACSEEMCVKGTHSQAVQG